MGIGRLFKRDKVQNSNIIVSFLGKMDLKKYPDREVRTSIAMRIDANFRSSWGNKLTPGNKPSICLHDEGTVFAQYMIVTTDANEAYQAGIMLRNLWDPWTILAE